VANNPTNAEKGILTNDRVHLNAKGNAFVAEAMWKALQ
jgi:lysophospholipase L1-like esterase